MSFRLKTILGIVIIETILLVVLVLGSLSFLTSSNEKLFKDRVNTTADLFTLATTNAVISSDIATLESFIEEIKSHPEIKFTQILNASNEVMAEYKSSDFTTQKINNSEDNKLFWLNRSISEQGQVYGTVRIGISDHELKQAIDEALNWDMRLAAFEILLVALLSFILGTYLTQKLRRLTEASNQIKEHGPGFTIENSNHNKNDEISQVINAFNQMSIELENTYNEQNNDLLEYLDLYRINEQTNAQNQAILDASLEAIMTANEHGMIISVNSVAEKTFGWATGEMIGKNLTETIIPVHFREAHIAGMKRYAETNEAVVLDKVLQLEALHKEGHTFPIEISISKLKLENDTVFTAFVRDISQRIEAEKQLQISAVALESGDALIITDANYKILRVNQAYHQLTGYESEELIGKTPMIFTEPKGDKQGFREMWHALKIEGSWNSFYLDRTKEGKEYHVRVSVSAVTDDQNQPSHYVIHLVDISETKAAEKTLRDAQDKAEKASLAKSQFLANMSHEIRSPLNSIITVNELLLQSNLPNDAEKLVSISLSGGKSLMNIINDVLDFSKIEAGEMQLKQSRFNILRLIEETLDLFKHTAQEKNIHLSYIVEPDLNIYFIGDQVRVKQILTNLVNNAIKFTTQGGVSIRLKNSPNKELILEVRDTGLGLSKEDAEQVFIKFFQADDSNTKKYEGTGLGLAIVSSLTQLMKGQISLNSALGQGSTFTVELPLEIDPNKANTIQDKLNDHPHISELLLVSHEPFLQKEMIKQLKLFNIKTLSLADLEERTEHDHALVVLFTPPYSEQLDQDLAFITDKVKSNCTAYVLVDPVSSLELPTVPFEIHKKASPLHFDRLLSILSDQYSHTEALPNANHETSDDIAIVEDQDIEKAIILIVEDSKTNQVIAQKVLEQKGYHYEIANNGLEATEKANKQRYALILMDMRMPIMDGIEATKFIRSHQGINQNTPILAMTANAFIQDEINCLEAGMNDYLTKPIDINLFYEKVALWLDPTAVLPPHQTATLPENSFELSSSAKPGNALSEEKMLNQDTWNCLEKDVGKELFQTILDVYYNETKQRLEEMTNFWEIQDMDALSNEAHALKSSSGSFGLIQLQALALTIETKSKEPDLKAVESAMQQLPEVIESALDIISSHLNRSEEPSL